MKKLFRLIAISGFASVVLLMASCKADVQRSNITKSTWKLTSGSMVDEVIESHVYTDATPNTTSTQRNTTTFGNTDMSHEIYALMQAVGSPDNFTRNIDDFTYEITISFKENGSYDISITQTTVSTSSESTGSPIVTTPLSPNTQVNQSVGNWSLDNNNSTQTYLYMPTSTLTSINRWMVETLDENTLVISANSSTNNVTHPSVTETKTFTTSNTATLTWGH